MENILQGKRILVAEDEEISRFIVEKVLCQRGAKVISVTNGEEAVTQFLQGETKYFDLLLLDLNMPKLGGLEACKQIRSSQKKDAKSVLIYGLTADLFVSPKEIRDSGMTGCLEKPFQYEEVEKIFGG